MDSGRNAHPPPTNMTIQAGLHPAGLSWGSGSAGPPMHSCIAGLLSFIIVRLNNILGPPKMSSPPAFLHANSFFSSLMASTSTPDFLASNASKGNETLWLNLMPVIPSRRSVYFTGLPH